MTPLTTRDPFAIASVFNGARSQEMVGEPGVARLLLVDDDRRMLTSLYELLKEFDYDIVISDSAREAVGHLSRSKFDLVLLDLRMPEIDGHQLMDTIIARKFDVSVIVVSGERDIDAAIGALKRGAFGYLRKPYKAEELLNTVSQALQKRKLEAEHRDVQYRLECSESLYRYLVDSLPDIIYTIDPDGNIAYINDRAQQLLGFTREQLIGQHYSILVHDEDLERARYVFQERRSGNRASRNVELRLKCHHAGLSERVFENTLLTISFNATALYSVNERDNSREFFGTYGVARDITELKRAEQRISYQAYHDVLTDLPNRILFKDRLDLAIIHANRNKTGLAVMFVDLDRFKWVNDTLGHIKGDELLQDVSQRMKQNLRRGDTLARVGGDEFTLLLPDLRSEKDAALIAKKFLWSLEQPFELDGKEVHISASIGIAVYPTDGSSMEDLLRHADIAMYQVKTTGKNGYRFYDHSMEVAANQKVALEQSLRRALEHGELEMYYQPQIDIATGRILGAEALMRWNHPERGLLTAGEFLPFAEDNGLMLPITDWMMKTVCQDLQKWNASSAEVLQISMNLSPQCLDRSDIVRKLSNAIVQYGIDPAQLEVEITENVCIRNPQHALEQLKGLSGLGVGIAIDDFGTGYSSLAYLQRFPARTIKIDQCFIRDIEDPQAQYPVILAIISVAKGLGLRVIAEGVETESQSSYLQQVGCNLMQGFLFYKPMSRTDLTHALAQNACV